MANKNSKAGRAGADPKSHHDPSEPKILEAGTATASIAGARADLALSAINALLNGGQYHSDAHGDQGTGHADGSHYDLHLDTIHSDHGDEGDFGLPWEELIQQEMTEVAVAASLFARLEQRVQRFEALAKASPPKQAVRSKEFFAHYRGRLEALLKKAPTRR